MNVITNLEEKKCRNRGITLIALVITIIVLLILAGISIAMLTGDNGILKKATTAKEETTRGAAEEKVKIAVYGSYDTTGNVNINELNSNLENIEGIDKTDLPLIELPATVIVDGYTFLIEQNGKVELSGPRPVAGEITVTLEDGSAIPEGGAEAGIKLKIDFTATIEGGTIESISPQVPYITNGTEKEVRFTITGKVNGTTYSTQKIINLKEYYKKTEFEVEDIVKNPTAFYGSVVDNYAVNANATEAVKNAVTTWRIFYAGKEPNGTENNIYLIADDYIHYTVVPNGKGGTAVTRQGEYQMSFDNVINDYDGGKFIWENSLGKNWLSKYLNYTTDNGVTYPNREESTNYNIRATSYLMDTNVWSGYEGDKAKYAMGGPTLEMFVESCKDTHIESSFNFYIDGTVGYIWPNDMFTDNCQGIHRKTDTSKAYGMWIASPSNYTSKGQAKFLIRAHYSGGIYGNDLNNSLIGCRPIVCLKSGVELEKKSEGVYSIK